MASAPINADVDDISGIARVLKGDVVIINSAKVRLFGIAAPEPKKHCGISGGEWPCGGEAKAALADLVNGKHLRCKVKNKVGHGYWQATCALENVDVAGTLVDAGWAQAVPDMTDAYTELEERARGAKKGI